jgi:hypothetical protein
MVADPPALSIPALTASATVWCFDLVNTVGKAEISLRVQLTLGDMAVQRVDDNSDFGSHGVIWAWWW